MAFDDANFDDGDEDYEDETEDYELEESSMDKGKKNESWTELDRLQVENLIHQTGDLNLRQSLGNLVENQKDEEIVSLFEKWLVRRASCPTTFSWEDLGEYFWPRYIRRGSCSGDPEEEKSPQELSCSWPRGMTCQPHETKTLHILRWHCKRKRRNAGGSSRRRTRRSGHRCKWYKVPYPVTSTCKCGTQVSA